MPCLWWPILFRLQMAQLDLTDEQIDILFSKVHISGLIDIEWVYFFLFLKKQSPLSLSCCPFSLESVLINYNTRAQWAVEPGMSYPCYMSAVASMERRRFLPNKLWLFPNNNNNNKNVSDLEAVKRLLWTVSMVLVKMTDTKYRSIQLYDPNGVVTMVKLLVLTSQIEPPFP